MHDCLFLAFSRAIRVVLRSNLENGLWAALGMPRAALGALASSLAGQGLLWELSEVQLYNKTPDQPHGGRYVIEGLPIRMEDYLFDLRTTYSTEGGPSRMKEYHSSIEGLPIRMLSVEINLADVSKNPQTSLA